MSRGLAAFTGHPWTFEQARSQGLQRGIVTYVVDGDTYDILADDGRHQYAVLNVRLRGIDTPELYSGTATERERGAAAGDFMTALFADNQWFVLFATFKDAQTFGRWVADVYVKPLPPAISPPGIVNVTQLLREAGHVA